MANSLISALSIVKSATTAAVGVESALTTAIIGKDWNKSSALITAMALQSFGSVENIIKFFQTYTNVAIALAGDSTFVNEEGHILNASKVKAYETAERPFFKYKDYLRNILSQSPEFSSLGGRVETASIFVVTGFKAEPKEEAKDTVKAAYAKRKAQFEAFQNANPIAISFGIEPATNEEHIREIPTSEGISVFMMDVKRAKAQFTKHVNAANESQEDKDTKTVNTLNTAIDKAINAAGEKVNDKLAEHLSRNSAGKFFVLKGTNLQEMQAAREALRAAGLAHLIVTV